MDRHANRTGVSALAMMLAILAFPLNAVAQAASLSLDSPITDTVDIDHNTFTYSFSASSGYYTALALKPPVGADMDLYLYDDAGMTNQILKSSGTGHALELVVVDRNGLPQRNYYAKAKQIQWDGTFNVELDGGRALSPGVTTGSFSTNEIIEAWDISLASGEKCAIGLTNAPAGAITSLYAFYGNSFMANRTDYTTGYLVRGETGITFFPKETGDYCIVLVNENAATGAYSISVDISAGDFCIEAYPSTLTNATTYQGGKAIFPMNIIGLGDMQFEVTLSLYNPPTGCTYSFAPQVVMTTNFSALEVLPGTTPPGTYNIRVDGTSGASTRSINLTLIVTDPTGLPFASITSLSPNPCPSGSALAYSGQGSGNILGCVWRSSINGEFSQAFTGTTTALAEGMHVIYFKVQDNLGQWSPEAQAWAIVVPKDAVPSITITSPSDGSALSGACEVAWNATGSIGGALAVTVECSADAGATWNTIGNMLPGNGTLSWMTYEYPNGSYLVKVLAVETLNVSGGKRVVSAENIVGPFDVANVVAANRLPKTMLLYPDNVGVVSTIMPLLAWYSVDEDGDALVYDVYLDTGDASTLVSRRQNYNYYYAGALSEGMTYSWRVVPFDGKAYGECMSGKFTFTLSGTNEPPSVVRSPESDISLREGTSTDMAVTATDPEGGSASFYWFIDGKDVIGLGSASTVQDGASFVSTFTYRPNYNSAGSHIVTALVVDTCAQRAASVCEFDVLVTNANRRPVAMIDAPREDAEFDANDFIQFSGNSSSDPDGDALRFIWLVDDSEIAFEKYFSAQLPPGNHTITLQVSDRQSENATSFAYVNVTITRTLKPSLEIYGVSLSPASAKEGENVVITASVKNTGMITTPIIALLFLVDGHDANTQSMNPIVPGDEGYAKFEWSAVAGPHSMTVRISSPLPSEAEIKKGEITEWIDVSSSGTGGLEWLVFILIGAVVAVLIVALVYRRKSAGGADRPIGAQAGMKKKDVRYETGTQAPYAPTGKTQRPQLPQLSSSLKAKERQQKTYISKMPKDYKRPSEEELAKIREEKLKEESIKRYTAQSYAPYAGKMENNAEENAEEEKEKPKPQKKSKSAGDIDKEGAGNVTVASGVGKKVDERIEDAKKQSVQEEAIDDALERGVYPAAPSMGIAKKKGSSFEGIDENDGEEEDDFDELEIEDLSRLGMSIEEEERVKPRAQAMKAAQPKAKAVNDDECPICGYRISTVGKCPKCSAVDLMLSAERSTVRAKQLGVKSRYLEGLVLKTRSAFKQERYEDAEREINEMASFVKEIGDIASQLAMFRSVIATLERNDLDTSEFDSLLMLVNSFLDTGNIEKAREYLVKIEMALKEFDEEAEKRKKSGNWVDGRSERAIGSGKANVKAERLEMSDGAKRICPNCENEVEPDWKLCPFCNSELD